MINRKSCYKITSCIIAGFSVLLVAVFAFAASSDDLAKQIDKDCRMVERHIITEPTKAEKELDEVKVLFSQLQGEAPDHVNISTLTTKIDQLDAKIAKRLGRDVKPLSKGPANPSSPKTSPSLTSLPSSEKVAIQEETPQKLSQGDKLPGGVMSRIKKIQTALDKVEKNLDNNSVDRAQFEYKQIPKIREEIEKNYGDQIPTGDTEMKAMQDRIAEVETRLIQAVDQAAAEKEISQAADAQAEALEKQWVDRFAPYLDRKSDKYLNIRVNDLDEKQTAVQKQNYNEAAALLGEYEKANFLQEKSMDLSNTEHSIKSTLNDLADTYGRQEKEAGSMEWVNRLEPYVSSGGEKVLIASAVSNADEIQARKKIFEEASAVFAEFQKTTFPLGKSYELQKLEQELAKRMAEFPTAMAQSASYLIEDAKKKIDQEAAFFASKQEWRTDSKNLPYTLDDDRIADMDRLIADAADSLSNDDPEIKALREKKAAIVQENDERRSVRTARTYMIGDKFTGKGEKEIKTKAENLVSEKYPEAKILRTTIINIDWNEETLEEWTDTTKTALRWRTTRSVTTQVAAKRGKEVRLFTLYIAKNKNSDGSWGSLFGNLHSDKGDLMLEANVKKDAP